MIWESPMTIAGRLEADPNRQAILAKNRDQRLMPVLGNVDGYKER